MAGVPVDVQEWELLYIITVTDMDMSFLAASRDNVIMEELGQGAIPSVRNVS